MLLITKFGENLTMFSLGQAVIIAWASFPLFFLPYLLHFCMIWFRLDVALVRLGFLASAFIMVSGS
jgi:hypothetical protein